MRPFHLDATLTAALLGVALTTVVAMPLEPTTKIPRCKEYSAFSSNWKVKSVDWDDCQFLVEMYERLAEEERTMPGIQRSDPPLEQPSRPICKKPLGHFREDFCHKRKQGGDMACPKDLGSTVAPKIRLAMNRWTKLRLITRYRDGVLRILEGSGEGDLGDLWANLLNEAMDATVKMLLVRRCLEKGKKRVARIGEMMDVLVWGVTLGQVQEVGEAADVEKGVPIHHYGLEKKVKLGDRMIGKQMKQSSLISLVPKSISSTLLIKKASVEEGKFVSWIHGKTSYGDDPTKEYYHYANTLLGGS